MKALKALQIMAGILGLVFLVTGIVYLFTGFDKTFAVAWVLGCFFVIVFLRVNREIDAQSN